LPCHFTTNTKQCRQRASRCYVSSLKVRDMVPSDSKIVVVRPTYHSIRSFTSVIREIRSVKYLWRWLLLLSPHRTIDTLLQVEERETRQERTRQVNAFQSRGNQLCPTWCPRRDLFVLVIFRELATFVPEADMMLLVILTADSCPRSVNRLTTG